MSAAAETATPPAYTIETGEIDGAKFTLARPSAWNRGVLLLAHGLRGEDRPLLADLFPEHLARQTLLAEGWIVATTSYRRNGLVVADGLADLDALRAHIEKKFGTPSRVIVEGESMGGLIATFLAERDIAAPQLYHGAIAIGAALQLREPGSMLGLTLQPRIPLVFVNNQTEFEAARNYVESKVVLDEPVLRPWLLRISRDGHVNVNQRERLFAFRALNLWLDHGRAMLPRPPTTEAHLDATVRPEPQPSRVTVHADGRGFDTRVTAIDAAHGNVTVDAQPADFAAIGLGRRARFPLTAHGETYRVVYGREFDSVKRGEWVMLPDAEGFFLLARNFADAAATARLAVGDPVTVRRYDEPR